MQDQQNNESKTLLLLEGLFNQQANSSSELERNYVKLFKLDKAKSILEKINFQKTTVNPVKIAML